MANTNIGKLPFSNPVNPNHLAKDRKGKTKGSKMRLQHDYSADYAREEQMPNMKRGVGRFEEGKDFSGYDPHNSMLSKAYTGATPYGK